MDLGPAPRRCSGTVIGRRPEDYATPHRLPHYGHIIPRDRFFPCLPSLFITTPLYINPRGGRPWNLPNSSILGFSQNFFI